MTIERTQNHYFSQVKLLLNLLPIIAKDPDLVLKGGTALNLFIRNMPRLSVDIDLIYEPLQMRNITLSEINRKLRIIGDRCEQVAGCTVSYIPSSPDFSRTLLCMKNNVQVKIEVNTIIRGTLWKPQTMRSSPSVEENFKQSVEMKVAHIGDLYGGKICAALDRQHPRDLFDVKLLLENEGITEEIKKGFLLYLISHNRPMSELLHPHLLDMKQTFTGEFLNMTDANFSYDDFEKTRSALVELVQTLLTQEEKQFLISFKQGDPKWELLSMPDVQQFPAVQWKLHNIRSMSNAKRSVALQKLEEVLLILK